MFSLIRFNSKNSFRIYSIFFFLIAITERYFVYDTIPLCSTVSYPYFFEKNFIRLLFIVIPYFYIFLFSESRFDVTELRTNTVFLLVSLSALALTELTCQQAQRAAMSGRSAGCVN